MKSGKTNAMHLENAARKLCCESGENPDELVDPLPGINAPSIERWRLYISLIKRKKTPPPVKEAGH